MARRTKAEAEKTREALLDAAERLFAELGVADTSLEDIAQAAMVTRGALYWHFRNKADLFAALVDRAPIAMEVLLGRVAAIDTSGDFLSRLHQALIAGVGELVAAQERHRVLAEVFHRCKIMRELQPVVERCQAVRGVFTSRLEALFTLAADRGLLAAAWTGRAAGQVVAATLLGLFVNWLQRADPGDLAEQAALCLNSLFASFTVPPASGALA